MDYAPGFYQVPGPQRPVPDLNASNCELTIYQQPAIGKVCVGDEKNRTPLDPPPVVRLTVSRAVDACDTYFSNPNLFMQTTLVRTDNQETPKFVSDCLTGCLTSSLYRLRDINDKEGAFFVFPDMSVKFEGFCKLRFSLFDLRNLDCFYVGSVETNSFRVYMPRHFTGMAESTAITRKFSEQGVRFKLRKAPRALLRQSGPASEDYIPRRYKSQRMSQSHSRSPRQTQRKISRDEGPRFTQPGPQLPLPPFSFPPAVSRGMSAFQPPPGLIPYTTAPPYEPQQPAYGQRHLEPLPDLFFNYDFQEESKLPVPRTSAHDPYR